ncbi:MAG TPA: hypothetical protein VGP95_06775 [Gemmatimonadaceae bacterium]|nr:hypothetical protein [Gemmatimonadaceae bacterium]
MHRTAARSLALGALALVVGRPAASQGSGIPASASRPPTSPPVALNILWSGPTLTAADRERLHATILRADALARENKLGEASRLYWSVVSEQHAAEDYPVEALRRLAFMYFSAGDDYSAASVLTELAEVATNFGDPATRLQSLFDAALLYRELARTDRMLECVRQIRPLLKSAAIPEAARLEISNRIMVR